MLSTSTTVHVLQLLSMPLTEILLLFQNMSHELKIISLYQTLQSSYSYGPTYFVAVMWTMKWSAN